MTYWLNLFTVETWQEFKEAGAHLSGHSASRWSRASRVRPGDRLLCYLVGAYRWIGVLEVTEAPFFDDSEDGRIWTKDLYPSRLPVRVELELTPDTAVPVKDMINTLSVFEVLDSPQDKWGTLFLGSLNRWPDEDGHRVENAIKCAMANPINRPLPRSATRMKVRTAVDTDAGPVTIPEETTGELADDVSVVEGSEHTWAQLLLARMGTAMGYQVFVPASDRGKTYGDQRLEDVTGLVTRLHLPLIPAAMRIIENIDVLWLDRDAVQAAFEVERTTAIYSGILRMTDLLSLQPNLDIECYLVAPDDRQQQIVQQVNRPTFARMRQPFSNVCRFISFGALSDEQERGQRAWRHQRFSYVTDELSESVTLGEI